MPWRHHQRYGSFPLSVHSFYLVIYMRYWIGSQFKDMACVLFCAKPLPCPILSQIVAIYQGDVTCALKRLVLMTIRLFVQHVVRFNSLNWHYEFTLVLIVLSMASVCSYAHSSDNGLSMLVCSGKHWNVSSIYVNLILTVLVDALAPWGAMSSRVTLQIS